MEVHDNFVSIHQELLGLAGSFGPGPASFCDVFLHFRDTTISTGCWEAIGLNAHNLWIKILGYGLHVVAIDCSEEMLQRFNFGTHGNSPLRDNRTCFLSRQDEKSTFFRTWRSTQRWDEVEPFCRNQLQARHTC